MQAPDFTLEHVAGVQMALSEFLGDRPVVVILAGKATAAQAETIGKSIGEVVLDDVQMISIVHAAGVPRMARPLAKRDVRKTYESAAADALADRKARGLPMGPPERTVVMLLDWEGRVAPLLGVGDPGQAASAVLLAPDGTVKARASGDGAGAAILAELGRS